MCQVLLTAHFTDEKTEVLRDEGVLSVRQLTRGYQGFEPLAGLTRSGILKQPRPGGVGFYLVSVSCLCLNCLRLSSSEWGPGGLAGIPRGLTGSAEAASDKPATEITGSPQGTHICAEHGPEDRQTAESSWTRWAAGTQRRPSLLAPPRARGVGP